MDGLTDMQREIIQRGIVTKEKALQFNESLNLDEYGTRERPTVSPLASDKPLQRAYKWFSAAESLANSCVGFGNFDNLVRKGNEHISMVETSHLGPESPRTEAERYSLGRRVSKWKTLVARWEEAAARSAEPAAAAARGPTTEEERRAEIREREAAEPLPEGWTRIQNPNWNRTLKGSARRLPYYYHNAGWAEAGAPRTIHTIWSHPGLTPPLPWTPPDDVSDAGHAPEVLPDAFTEAAAFFRAAPKSTLGPEAIAALGRRHLEAVDVCISSSPLDARGTIKGYYMKWGVLRSRWAAAAGAEVELDAPFTGTVSGIESLDMWRRAQQYYRGIQRSKRTCLMCGKTAPLSSSAFCYCSGCRRADVARSRWARYCSEACQRAHWLAGHADECPCAHGDG